MIPDFNKELSERMEQASLKELMPEFDADHEWQQLSAKLGHVGKRRIQLGWLKIAAMLVLLAGGGWLSWELSTQSDNTPMAGNIVQPGVMDTQYRQTVPVPQDGSIEEKSEAVEVSTMASPKITEQGSAVASAQMQGRKKNGLLGRNQKGGSKVNKEQFFNYYMANEFVCNGTQCPIEICIVQTFRCNNAKPSAVATCSTLAPDEARQLRYKAVDKSGKDCKVTVDEIRIKRVSTGETIVLNSNSKPATAEELFSCITGDEQCSVLAGIFDADCNDHCKPHDLTIYNNKGNLILQ